MSTSFSKILVPVDFSDFSDLAIGYGLEFAKTFGAELLVLHVLDLPYSLELGMGVIPPNMSGEILEDVERRLAEYADQAKAAGVEVRAESVEGTDFVEIVRYARDQAVDLIVMPTHGRTGVTHLLIGSTAERVVRKAPCPVLVVRDGQSSFVMP